MLRSRCTRTTALGRVGIDAATSLLYTRMWSEAGLRMYCMQCTDFVLGAFVIICNDKHERRSESEICLITGRPRRYQIMLR
jgi:hypothetical protein